MPKPFLRTLQWTQNAAPHLWTGTQRRQHITPVWASLHWLPVRSRIDVKILLISYKVLHSQGPPNIEELIEDDLDLTFLFHIAYTWNLHCQQSCYWPRSQSFSPVKWIVALPVGVSLFSSLSKLPYWHNTATVSVCLWQGMTVTSRARECSLDCPSLTTKIRPLNLV